jgi:hypothetical protein
VKISFIGVLIVGLFFSLTDQPLLLLLGKNVSGTTMIGFFPRRNYIRDYLWIKSLIDYVRKNGIDGFMKLLFDIQDAVEDLDEREKEFLRSFTEQQSNLQKAAGQTWQFWAGAFIILYFLVSISVSSILGEWDAKDGKKSMIGGWQAEATYIYSDKENLPLPLYQARSHTQMTNIYGPMMILGKNEDNYYLTDWVDAFPITSRPKVYVIKVNENMALGMQMFASTPTPFVTPGPVATATSTPSSTPMITSTP